MWKVRYSMHAAWKCYRILGGKNDSLLQRHRFGAVLMYEGRRCLVRRKSLPRVAWTTVFTWPSPLGATRCGSGLPWLLGVDILFRNKYMKG